MKSELRLLWKLLCWLWHFVFGTVLGAQLFQDGREVRNHVRHGYSEHESDHDSPIRASYDRASSYSSTRFDD